MILGVVGNPDYHDLPSLLRHVAQAAPRHGFTIQTEPRLLPLWPDPKPPVCDFQRLDGLLTFGGDGTLLRGARLLAGAQVPIFGINVGRVGFLATAASQDLDAVLAAIEKQGYTVEPRMALVATVEDREGSRRGQPIALNDVAVHKGGVARVIRFRVSVDGDEVGAYSADGIIVATPTGSTAYSLSAGGPIVVPGVDALAVTAICPHTLAVRPLVIPSTAVVSIEPLPPWTDTEEVVLSIDGQVGQLIHEGERLFVRRAEHPVLLGRIGLEGFFARIRRKLQWGDLTDREIAR